VLVGLTGLRVGLVLLLLGSRICVWGVALGGTLSWSVDVGTLLGPEGTPRWGLFLLAPGLDRLTHSCVGVVVVRVGWGVVVC
jgi:hypothetical protein